ncbi:MAG: HD domain-containing phosphohydrolase, partial [Brevefilum sp.]
EQTRRQLEQLEILRKIDSLITTSLTLDEALPVLLQHVRDGLDVDAAAVLLFDEASNTLKLESWLGLKEEPQTDKPIALGQGNSGEIAQTKESIFIPEVTYGEKGADFPIIWYEEEVTSFYGLPMLVKGQLEGVLELFHRNPLDPDEEWINFAETLCGQAAIAVDNITLFNDLQQANENLRKAYDKTIEGWATALELRDQETEGHSERVVNLSLEIAREFGFEEKDLPHIRRGVFLHDIGKMGIPDRILRKPGPLTEEEWEIMRQHPKFAYNMLKDIDYLEPALKIPHYHHERWDGSGYPEGREGEEIPLEARIFMVVDIWDALTSDRPYRDAWSEEKTIKYLKEQAGKELDPEVVEVFLEIIQEDRK